MRNKKAIIDMPYSFIVYMLILVVCLAVVIPLAAGIDLSGLRKIPVSWDTGYHYDFINEYGESELCTHNCLEMGDIWHGVSGMFFPDDVRIVYPHGDTVQIYCLGTLSTAGSSKAIICEGEEAIDCVNVEDTEYLTCDPAIDPPEECVVLIGEDQYMCVKLKMDTEAGEPEEYTYVLIHYLDTWPNSKFKWWEVGE